jgi:ABC-type Fe3+-hydroxamate transport system substrate-binding protein
MKKFIRICFVLLMVTVISAGCVRSTVSERHMTEEELRAFFLEKAEAVEITENTVIFTDSSGERREIEKNPGRVIGLHASLTTLWYEAGGEVVGCIGTKSTKELYTEMIGRDITLDAGMTVVASSAAAKNWDTESIIAQDASLILCSTAMSGYTTVKGPASAAGIPVIAADYDDFSDYLKWFKVFTGLCGTEDRWEWAVEEILGEVVDLILSVPAESGVKVLSVFADSDSLSANTSSTVIGEMISMLGGINAAHSDAVNGAERIDINLEAVYAADPDVILVQCHTDRMTAEAQIDSILGDNPVWQSLDAVKGGRVYYLEKSLFHSKPNSRFAEAYRILWDIFYTCAE